jgi:hypothetical protein
MPEILKVNNKTTLKRFVLKRLVYYIIPNIVFNTVIAYASFNKLGHTCLFEGEQSVARLTLPMALFLPFIITLDIIKRTIQATEQGTLDLMLDESLVKNKFMLQMSIVNGLGTFLLILTVMLGAQLALPAHYKLDATVMAFLDGVLAAILSIIFTYLPIRKLRKHMFKSAEISVTG